MTYQVYRRPTQADNEQPVPRHYHSYELASVVADAFLAAGDFRALVVAYVIAPNVKHPGGEVGTVLEFGGGLGRPLFATDNASLV